ncbi:DUF2474 domain-containing protein [Pelagibius sp. Alg239-R121]|nr:DUF2474 domain-containing protein [Pelagibius sp. Alg239-R121]
MSRSARDGLEPNLSTLRKLLWFVGLWVAGVATLGIIGYSIRYWLGL